MIVLKVMGYINTHLRHTNSTTKIQSLEEQRKRSFVQNDVTEQQWETA